MTSVLLAKLCQPFPCFILYSKAKFACYSRYLLTSYFCISVPYDEKKIFFWCQFYKFLQVITEPFNFSFFGTNNQGIDLDCVLVAQLCLTLCNSIDACQVPPSMGFSRQEYQSGLPFPSTGDLPNLWIKHRSLNLQANFLPSEPVEKTLSETQTWITVILNGLPWK